MLESHNMTCKTPSPCTECTVHTLNTMSNSRTLASNWQYKYSPKYNDDFFLLISQYLISEISYQSNPPPPAQQLYKCLRGAGAVFTEAKSGINDPGLNQRWQFCPDFQFVWTKWSRWRKLLSHWLLWRAGLWFQPIVSDFLHCWRLFMNSTNFQQKLLDYLISIIFSLWIPPLENMLTTTFQNIYEHRMLNAGQGGYGPGTSKSKIKSSQSFTFMPRQQLKGLSGEN